MSPQPSDDRFAQFNGNAPANPASITRAETDARVSLPKDYREFLGRMNGGQGFVGPQFVSLYRVEDLIEMNEGYRVAEFAPGLFLFGSNGGGEAFCFDMREPTMPIVMVPFILDVSDAISVGSDFNEFLDNLYNDRLFESRRRRSDAEP